MTKNRFIIIIAGRNNAQWVKQNLESVLVQDYDNYKIAFFDDASDDGTDQIAIATLGHSNPKVSYTLQTERQMKTWFFAHLEEHVTIYDNDILVFLDGDDFLACENVLSYLNSIYNQTNCWMTYGGMLVWNGGENYVEPYPQNSEIPTTILATRDFRRDTWRTSHLKTMRGFLWKQFNKKDIMPNGQPMVGPDDLAIMYAMLEMTPNNKIYRVTEPIYIYNHSPENQQSRAYTEHKATGIDYERMIRTRKSYDIVPIISPLLAGGLGNQMFEVAAAASLAKDNGVLLVINPEEHILPNQGRNVKNYLTNIFGKIMTDPAPLIQASYEWPHASYKPIPFHPNLKLKGHFQSFKYFHHNRDYIVRLLTPSIIQTAKQSKITAIQVRRGDYYKFPGYHFYLTPDYYAKAVKLADPEEVHVFSDDIPWCEQNLKFEVPVVYKKSNSDWEEMLDMSTYHTLVISNSSFGWWAAYLNTRRDRQIFTPSEWFGPKIVEDGFNMDDLVLQEWTRIEL